MKTVVDASVDSGVDADEEKADPTAALFPWGSKNQKGPDGEKVVSARAIKHVDALAAIAKEGVASAAVLATVRRSDGCSSSAPRGALPVVRRAPGGCQESRRDPRRAEDPLGTCETASCSVQWRQRPRRCAGHCLPGSERGAGGSARGASGRARRRRWDQRRQTRVSSVRVVVRPRCCRRTYVTTAASPKTR